MQNLLSNSSSSILHVLRQNVLPRRWYNQGTYCSLVRPHRIVNINRMCLYYCYRQSFHVTLQQSIPWYETTSIQLEQLRFIQNTRQWPATCCDEKSTVNCWQLLNFLWLFVHSHDQISEVEVCTYKGQSSSPCFVLVRHLKCLQVGQSQESWVSVTGWPGKATLKRVGSSTIHHLADSTDLVLWICPTPTFG